MDPASPWSAMASHEGAGLSSQKKRAREQARRREEKWQARQDVKAARRRTRWSIAAGITAVALVAVIVVSVVANRQEAAPGADGETASSQQSPQTPTEPTGTPPSPDLAEGRSWDVVMHTNQGDLTMTLDGAAAPQAVSSFLSLAREGFFDGTTCHRITTSEGFEVLQCGDPDGNGTGGPDYRFGPIENAPTDGVYPRGTIAMARVGGDGNSMGSQFFLVYGDTTIPDDAAGGYTVFGTITSGLDAIQAVADAGTQDGSADGQPAVPVTIEGVETQ